MFGADNFKYDETAGGFETLPYNNGYSIWRVKNAVNDIGCSIGVAVIVYGARQRPTAKKPIPNIFQIPHRNHPFRSGWDVRRFIITKMTTREGLKPSPTTTVVQFGGLKMRLTTLVVDVRCRQFQI
jgi:hypothetical protein